MMQHLPRILICAWILWIQARDGPYMYHDAFETKVECLEASKAIAQDKGRWCLPVGISPKERLVRDR
jgi:hypothetical protein